MVVQAQVPGEPVGLLPGALLVQGMWAYLEHHRMEVHDLSALYLLGPMGSRSPCRLSSTGSQTHFGRGRKHHLHPAWLFLLDLEEMEVSVSAN